MMPHHALLTLDRLWPTFEVAAMRWRPSPESLIAIAWVESRLQPDYTSPDGESGLMGMAPRVAAGIARKRGIPQWDLLDPHTALDFAACRLGELFQHLQDVRLAIAAYRVGLEAVELGGMRVPDSIPLHLYLRDVGRTLCFLDDHLPGLLDQAARATALDGARSALPDYTLPRPGERRKPTALESIVERIGLSLYRGELDARLHGDSPSRRPDLGHGEPS